MCIDFKNLNSACPKDYYPLPNIDCKVEAVMGFKYKCFLDAYKGYHQIQMAKEDEEKTAFYTEQGTYCYTKMPFGLKNAGATYQRLVDSTFQSQIGRNLEAYVDDMVIKSKEETSLLADIAETFESLKTINMKLNPKKCLFGVEEGKCLGYMVTSEGIRSNPKKTRAISDLQSPKTLKEMQSLSGKLASLNHGNSDTTSVVVDDAENTLKNVTKVFGLEKVNVDDTVDKSSSRTTVQPVTQPKAPTDLKLKKKKILPFSEPKSSHKVRVILLKKQVADTQPAEKIVATADATKSLDTSESTEEQVNRRKTVEAEKVQYQNVKEEVKESGLESIEDPSQLVVDAQINFLGVEPYNQTKSRDGDSDSRLHSMPDYDLVFMTGFETPNPADDDSKEGTGETFYAFADMTAQSDPLGHLYEELCILNNKIDQLESSITKKVTYDIQSFVPSIFADSLKENLPGLLSEALENTLP
ncbi:reverse transcriptase domain-containing protein [Tanacetum coccineum]